MGRTVLSSQRRSEIKKVNIGHIIIFCEGKTEKYYFDYFSEIIKKNKYTDVKVVLETANGNARAVLHFEELEEKLTKKQIYQRLTGYLHNQYSKGHRGKIREILINGDVEKAIDNAKFLAHKYKEQGLTMYADIREMNPFTSVYELIEQLMVEIS